MGLLRLFLAFSVAWYHVSDWTPVSSRAAVFCFFAISGYLITKTFVENYAGHGWASGRFYLNRLTRLLPTYWLGLVGTFLASWLIVGAEGGGLIERSAQYVDVARRSALLPMGDLLVEGAFLDFRLIPQGGTLVTEMTFYLLAPAVAWVLGRGVFWPLLIAALSLGLAFHHVYWGAGFSPVFERFPANAFTFLLGSLIYAVGVERILARRAIPLLSYLVPTVLLYVIFSEVTSYSDQVFFPFLLLAVLLVLVAMPVLMAIQSRLPAWAIRLDAKMGDLSFGVYIFHFLGAILVGGAEGVLENRLGVAEPLGVYRSALFVCVIMGVTLVLSELSIELVESPIRSLRARIRAKASPRPRRARVPGVALAVFSLGTVALALIALVQRPWTLEEAIAAKDANALRLEVAQWRETDTNPDPLPAAFRAAIESGADDLAVEMWDQWGTALTTQGPSSLELALLHDGRAYIEAWGRAADPPLEPIGCAAYDVANPRTLEVFLSLLGDRRPEGCADGDLLLTLSASGNGQALDLMVAHRPLIVEEDVASAAMCLAVRHAHGSLVERFLTLGMGLPDRCSGGEDPKEMAREAGADGLLALLREAPPLVKTGKEVLLRGGS